jgi:hypothetical protein
MKANDFWLRLIEKARFLHPRRIFVVSFGLYTAFNNCRSGERRPQNPNPLQELLYLMNKTEEISTLIATPANSEKQDRFLNEVAVLKREAIVPRVEVRIHPHNHSKIIIFICGNKLSDVHIWNGSLNFSSSNNNHFYDFLSTVTLKEEKIQSLTLCTKILKESKIPRI